MRYFSPAASPRLRILPSLAEAEGGGILNGRVKLPLLLLGSPFPVIVLVMLRLAAVSLAHLQRCFPPLSSPVRLSHRLAVFPFHSLSAPYSLSAISPFKQFLPRPLLAATPANSLPISPTIILCHQPPLLSLPTSPPHPHSPISAPHLSPSAHG